MAEKLMSVRELLGWNSPWAEEQGCDNLLMRCKGRGRGIPLVYHRLIYLLETLRTAGVESREPKLWGLCDV